MRCLVCGRAGERGDHERNIRRLLCWVLACVFVLGMCANAALSVVIAMFL